MDKPCAQSTHYDCDEILNLFLSLTMHYTLRTHWFTHTVEAEIANRLVMFFAEITSLTLHAELHCAGYFRTRVVSSTGDS